MENFMIQPWGASEDDLVPVPSEVENLARDCLQFYNLNVTDMALITSKPDKGGAIWKVSTNQGAKSLKLLHRRPARSLFSVFAQDYLVKQGARVPTLIKTKKGELYVELGGKVWIATEWIETLTPATKIDLSGAEALCYGLGEFHRRSKGYKVPKFAEKVSRLRHWPKSFEKIRTKLDWFHELAKNYQETPAGPTFLSMVEHFKPHARKAISLLEKSPYKKLVELGEEYWGIVHQDYGWSNGQMGPDGVWIIDLDGVSYDLPIRDLRKLISGAMDDQGVWRSDWILGMINAYHKANPITPEVYQVLLADFSLPNEFYKNVKDIVYDPVSFLNPETEMMLDRILQVDSTKWTALKEIEKWKGRKA